MTFQIAYEPEKAPLSHSIYELADVKLPGVWRKSFSSEAEAHRWIKANSVYGPVK